MAYFILGRTTDGSLYTQNEIGDASAFVLSPEGVVTEQRAIQKAYEYVIVCDLEDDKITKIERKFFYGDTPPRKGSQPALLIAGLRFSVGGPVMGGVEFETAEQVVPLLAKATAILEEATGRTIGLTDRQSIRVTHYNVRGRHTDLAPA